MRAKASWRSQSGYCNTCLAIDSESRIFPSFRLPARISFNQLSQHRVGCTWFFVMKFQMAWDTARIWELKLDITTAWMTVMAMCSLCGSERHKHHHSTLSFTTEAQLPYTQGNHCATLLVPYRTWIGMNSFQVCPSHSLTSEYDPWKMAFSTIDLPCNQTPLRSNRFRNTNSSQDDSSYFPFSNRDDL